MDRPQAAGKEKSAVYRQYFGNRRAFRRILDLYRQYGLIDQARK